MLIVVIAQQIQEIQVLLLGTSWNIFFSIFDPRLIESTDAEPADTEGRVYWGNIQWVDLEQNS